MYYEHTEKDTNVSERMIPMASEEVSDGDLSASAVAGNDDSFTALLERYISVIRKKAHDYSFCGIDVEDLIQEGTIGLINAVKAYDKSSGVDFFPFACICIDRSIITVVRKSLRKKQIPADMLVPLDDKVQTFNDNPEQVIIEKESFDRLQQTVRSKLNDFEFIVLNRYLCGESYRQIAEKLQCDVKKVDNSMYRIRLKLKRGQMS